ncbi:MAG: EAL domain-containing protein (putative c-di-GMP-specific phosphodiesterase class I) [Planctomycetota bacterium]|jgi:EAL domain-containing protein (putative c-di-GMP-specific phosphodiesterase class I)/CheY-like chemotaxis protein
MNRALSILAITPDSQLSTELANMVTGGGHTFHFETGSESAREALGSGTYDAVLVDGTADAGEISEAYQLTLQAQGPDRPAFILINPEGGSPLQTYRELGARDFLCVPVQADLLLLRLAELDTEITTAAPKEATNFLTRDAFLSETARRIPPTRSAGRQLAILGVSLHCVDPSFDWIGMEVKERNQIEQMLIESINSALTSDADTDSLGVHPGDFCMTWVRSDRVALLVPGLARVQDVAKFAGRFQERISSASATSGTGMDLHTSAGVAACPEDGADPSVLLDAAQDATERARSEGRNCLAFHTQAMGQWAFERLTLEKSLADALSNNELRVFYQPRVAIGTRQILGMEALIRWQHPQLGLVFPAQFIPLAEETGLITPIGEWVLREACRQNQEWREAGLPPIRVSVNLSPVQFRDPNLYKVVVDALEQSGLSCDGLELEVTESMLMNDPKVTIATLRELKAAGLKISIDDFGTGYSSLSYLKQFPIDSLKIDRSFVQDVTTNPDDAAIATAIILMGHSLKLNVVAEGVETESQLAFLSVLQCNEIQGYLFSPPVPADKAMLLLEKSILTV